LLSVILALALSACAPAASPPAAAPTSAPATAATAAPTPPAANAAPVELRMVWWGSQVRHDQTIKIIDLFQKKYPNIKVTYEFATFADYWPKRATEAAGKNLPDLMQHDYAYYLDYVNNNLIVPLDPYIADGTINLKDVPKDALPGGMVNGKLYALNAGTNSPSIVIDLDLFKQAGIEAPSQTWTWKDFEDISNKLHDKLGFVGNAGDLANPQIVNCYMLSLGQGLYSDDGKSLGYKDDKYMTDYLSMMLRMQKAGSMTSRQDQVASNYTVEKNPFVSGKAAMYFAHSNQLLAVWTAAGDKRNLKMMPVPRAVGATQSGNYFKASMFWSITSQAKHPKEAAMFIDFYTNNIDVNKVMLAERGIPISTVVQDAIKPLLPPAQVEASNFLQGLVGKVSPIRPPDPAKHNEIVTTVLNPLVFDAVMYEKATPEAAATLYRQQANKLLAQ
jgi:multiple sugar transport system substrate-binding protein